MPQNCSVKSNHISKWVVCTDPTTTEECDFDLKKFVRKVWWWCMWDLPTLGAYPSSLIYIVRVQGGFYNPTPLVSQLLDMVWFWNLYQRYPLWNDDIGDDLSDWVTWLMCNLQARSRFLMLSQILKMTLSITFFYQRYILWKV